MKDEFKMFSFHVFKSQTAECFIYYLKYAFSHHQQSAYSTLAYIISIDWDAGTVIYGTLKDGSD